ncbi:VOC family protein [Aliiroseovarius marinus]|uniref:VOC family protein n=1 Tax=Aliiroseovarius marinus TaxID=2500159 RepID=UPI003D7E587D
MTPPVVCWAEIPVTDMDKAITFYNAVFKWTMEVDNTGPNPMATLGGAMDTTSGHLYPGKPSTDGNGPTVHIVVPDKLEDAAKRCSDAGGTVLCDPIDIPPGRFVYAIDPDGNSIGLFEPKA